MPFNLLLLPLLGGYVFISHWNRTRFDARRYSGERLLFHSAIAGAWFLFGAFIVTAIVTRLSPGLHEWWEDIVPFDYSATSLLAFLAGCFAWRPLNRIDAAEEEAEKALEQWGDFLEILLNRCLRDGQQVSLTMRNEKVYVGFVTSNVDPAFDRKYLTLIPMLSGYRDADTKQMVITTVYGVVYDRMISQGMADPESPADEFELVLPIAEVVSANLFIPDVYEMFEEAAGPARSFPDQSN